MTKLDLKGLNESQLEAVQALNGPFRVLAGAGSGKTRVLTTRIANLVINHKIPTKDIFVGTFSKKASEEMTSRLEKMIPSKDLRQLTIGTFHSICWHILADEYKLMNHPLAECFKWDSNGLGTYVDLKGYVSDAMKIVGMDPLSKDGYGADDILWIISCAKNQLMDAEKYSSEAISPQEQKVAHVYKLYEARKDQEKKIDFDDMLLKVYKLFLENNDILIKYQNKYKYMLIDEAQDNNYAQFELARMLASLNRNIMIVGDHNQSIYRFRGATPQEFLNFDKYFPETVTIKLKINYRSNAAIINFANRLISHNVSSVELEMIPSKVGELGNDHIRHMVVSNEDEEAEMVTGTVIGYNLQGVIYKEQCVLFRTSAQIRAIEDQFIRNKIPYVIYGGKGFYELTEVKHLTSFARLIVDKDDDEALEDVINVPSRYLGQKFMKELKEVAKSRKITLWSALKWIKVKPYQHKSIVDFMRIIEGLTKKYNSGELKNPKLLIEEIFNVTGYKDLLDKPMTKEEKEENDPLLNVNTLLAACEQYEDAIDLVEFIKSVNYTNKKDADAVQIMNIHKSKGLEMKKVYSIGWSEGLLPHRYAVESGDPEEVQEERRLAYVAVTRAIEDGHLYSPLSFNNRSVEVSRFVHEGNISSIVE